LLVSGVGAWGAAKFVQRLVDEEPPALRIPQVLLHGGAKTAALAFPASHVAVVAALTVAAAPYLRQAARRVCWLIVALIAIARVYVGLHLPIDVVGGLALGVTLAAAVNVAFGVPARGPPHDRLVSLMATVARPPFLVTPGAGTDHLRCFSADGEGFEVTTLTSDRPDQGWLSRLWRLAAYRERSERSEASSPSQRGEHHAYMSLLTERAGVRTPALVLIRDISPQMTIIVERLVDASPYGDVADERLTDEVLVDAWRQLGAVHAAGVLHRGVDPAHLLVGARGQVWVVGWRLACAGASEAERSADLAEMAVTLASRADPVRVVKAAEGVLRSTEVTSVLAHLHPLALSPATRKLVVGDPSVLARLRSAVAEIDGREVEPPLSLTRVALRNLLPIVLLGVAAYVLLPQAARSSTSLSGIGHVRWPWLIAVAVASAATYVIGAAALMAASGRRLPLSTTIAAQLAAAFTNRVLPAGLGAAATNTRYLELSGMDRSSAISAIGLLSIARFVVNSVATIVAVALLSNRAVALHVPDIDVTWPALLALAVACAVIGWVVWVRRLHTPLLRWARVATGSTRAILTRPVRLAVLLGASVGVSMAYVLALTAALAAYGAHPGIGPVAGVYLASSAVAAATPTPGGVGAFEAGAVAAFGAVGVKASFAVTAVITFRLITYWLPVGPGGIALRTLRRRGLL